MGTGRGKDTVAWTSPFPTDSCTRAAVHSWGGEITSFGFPSQG